MPSLWMPGAKAMPTSKDGGSMTGGENLVTWHYFVAPTSMSASSGMKYLHAHGTTVHFTFNVLTGEVVQGIPANRAGRGLKNRPGGVQTNRRGRVNFQIEVMANSPHWWKELTPAGRQGLARMMAFFRSWGVPDQWAGQPGNTHDTPNGKSGHTGHNNWVENDHGDYLSAAPWDLVGGVKTTTPAATKTSSGARTRGPFPLPKGHWFGPESKDPKNHSGYSASDRPGIKQIQSVVGVTADGRYGPNTKAAVAAWQKARKLTADGLVGPVTWNAMGASR